jgi:hypothetical protein
MAVPSFRDLANKANAQKSTGPRTEAGKAKSRMNGVKHGLCCVEVVPDADREEYEARCARWLVEQKPETDADMLSRRRAVKSAMQLDRCGRREARLVDQQYHRLLQHKTAKAEDVVMRAIRLHRVDPGLMADLFGSSHACRQLALIWDGLAEKLEAAVELPAEGSAAVQALLTNDPESQQEWGRLADSRTHCDNQPLAEFCRLHAVLLIEHAQELVHTDEAEEHRALLDEAFFLPNPELDRVRKYEAIAERAYDRHYKALRQSRKEREREARALAVAVAVAGRPEPVSPCESDEGLEETTDRTDVASSSEAIAGRQETVGTRGKSEPVSPCDDGRGHDGGDRTGRPQAQSQPQSWSGRDPAAAA